MTSLEMIDWSVENCDTEGGRALKALKRSAMILSGMSEVDISAPQLGMVLSMTDDAHQRFRVPARNLVDSAVLDLVYDLVLSGATNFTRLRQLGEEVDARNGDRMALLGQLAESEQQDACPAVNDDIDDVMVLRASR